MDAIIFLVILGALFIWFFWGLVIVPIQLVISLWRRSRHAMRKSVAKDQQIRNERHAAYLAEQRRLAEEFRGSHPGRCLVLARTRRLSEDAWAHSRTCLGGLPPIDPAAWPLKPNGRPLHCVAQVDMADLAGIAPFPMPNAGTLAAFVDTSSEIEMGALRFVPAGQEQMLTDLPPAFDQPDTNLYERDWQYQVAGYARQRDVPKVFLRWPLNVHQAQQNAFDPDPFEPPLAELLGPKAKSVHFDLDGIVDWTDDRQIYREEDARSFPATAARAIIAEIIYHLAGDLDQPETMAPIGPTNNAVNINEPQIDPNLLVKARSWAERLAALDPYAPLGDLLGSEFNADLLSLKESLREHRIHLRLGSGTTVTGGAAKRAYFEMYTGEPRAFEAIPNWAREQIETTRMRGAYGSGTPHQMFGQGAQIQGARMDDKLLFLQIASDDALGMMWGDVGVLQWWIGADDLAAGRFEKAEFTMEGH